MYLSFSEANWGRLHAAKVGRSTPHPRKFNDLDDLSTNIALAKAFLQGALHSTPKIHTNTSESHNTTLTNKNNHHTTNSPPPANPPPPAATQPNTLPSPTNHTTPPQPPQPKTHIAANPPSQLQNNHTQTTPHQTSSQTPINIPLQPGSYRNRQHQINPTPPLIPATHVQTPYQSIQYTNMAPHPANIYIPPGHNAFTHQYSPHPFAQPAFNPTHPPNHPPGFDGRT